MILNYIGERPAVDNNAGNKARRDIDRILTRRGYHLLENIIETRFGSTLEKINYVLNVDTWKKIVRLCKVDGLDVIAQFPVYGNRLMRATLNELFDCNRMVFVIHDLDALRNFAAQSAREELERLNRAQLLIVHNRKMRDKLIESGVKTKMIELGLFDYLLDEVPPAPSVDERNRIVFAGNLAKSTFLRSINEIDVECKLFGAGIDENILSDKVSYGGSYSPEEIPFKLGGGVGLIWDGDSIDTCSGAFGTYLKLNNPHKLSLYIAAGLPVVTWTEAAIADFIVKHGIGFTVESLRDLPTAIGSLTADESRTMVDNSARIRKEIVIGRYTDQALDRVEDILGGGG
ncbi:MAG: hypothetical protein IJU71_06825 [Selenomonadaceae bacterium]|nr:hypothetical protein [Selenomonadaceae bacterium]